MPSIIHAHLHAISHKSLLVSEFKRGDGACCGLVASVEWKIENLERSEITANCEAARLCNTTAEIHCVSGLEALHT